MRKFPVIPGEIYFPDEPIGIASRVLGYMPGSNDSPRVIHEFVSARDFSPIPNCALVDFSLNVFCSMHLPLGERLATTSALALYNGGRA